ncbi:hypothetical protein LTR35_002686 [Friedmanniomyces endolithicus]|uniref:Uncharacterized protein n=1 Tax=Friedmanniomyces endolithicus TaxID=329885 RepID=A0AAN6G2G5_9PEZI|nr:hypothetical protein LTS00_009951 [Friedmanniomyces endolithicus]KAK0289489.1 hypothetical protein LTR35_002686 [Friedmanniomyces endolithicus]KAK0328737.1 hypothetical protein LTR82_000669 [Friedmanniomyces endolithicus]KAK1019568.1 hypothetical protein LTR54_000210 [Friedmanniomyces endolithicus]
MFSGSNALFITSFTGGLVALVKIGNLSWITALFDITLVTASYLFGAFGSLLIYRLFLAPICRFPGPWQAKLSSLWFMGTTGKTDCYLRLQALHEQYGPYVRIGSNDLSVIDPAIMEPAFGLEARATKAEWYDLARPYDSLHTMRDKPLHDRRRRIWAPGDKSLRGYEGEIQGFNDKLLERVRQHGGGGINVSKWFGLYSFDVMGQLAFSKNYGMLDSGELHWAVELLAASMEASPPKPPVWLFQILVKIPGLLDDFHKFIRFCKSELKSRAEHKGPGHDITGWLLKAYQGVANPEEDPMFQGDTRLIIVAGSDTTSACLTFLFYELAKHPEEVKKLRDELLLLTRHGEWSDNDVKHAPHLNGAINESLRMHPPVPSGVQRLTPAEGMQVGETFVPGNVNFWVPMYPMGRGETAHMIPRRPACRKLTNDRMPDESIYERALEFCPERWYAKPEMVKHKEAFAPFSTGHYGCIGKGCKSSLQGMV